MIAKIDTSGFTFGPEVNPDVSILAIMMGAPGTLIEQCHRRSQTGANGSRAGLPDGIAAWSLVWVDECWRDEFWQAIVGDVDGPGGVVEQVVVGAALCRLAGYVDVVAGSVAGQGLRAREVGIIR